MRTLISIFVLVLISACTLYAQNDLEKQLDNFVQHSLELKPSNEFLHHLKHLEEDGIEINETSKQTLRINWLKSQFYQKHRNDYRKKELQNLPLYGMEQCAGHEDPTVCKNGGFEDGFDAYLERTADGYTSGGDNCVPNVTYNAYEPAGSSGNAHISIVTQGQDEVVPILDRVRFEDHAARINSFLPSDDTTANSCFNFEVDQLVKKFWVTEETSLFTMHYAVVLQNPANHNNAQPFFNVRIFLGPDYVDEIYDFCFDAENDTELVTYENAVNPEGCGSNQNIKFKDWSCLSVDLSEYLDCPMLLEITTSDCGAGAHYGYSYVDGICEKCDETPGEPLVFIDDVGPCEENQVKITGHFEAPAGYDIEILELKGGGIEITTSDFIISGNEFCVYLSEQDFIDAGITDCASFTVTAVFNNGSDLITSVSSPVEICLDDVTCDGCLEVKIKNIQCLNNGTTDPSDDQWIFEILVSSSSPNSCGYWYSTGDVEEAGPLDSCKVIWMGSIANYGSTVNFTVFDGCDESCFEVIEIPVPEPCSPPCELETEVTEVSPCDENGDYTITIEVNGVTDDQCWMAIIKKEDGTTEVLGNYNGSGVFVLGPLPASEGNVVLWVKLCDFFDCLTDIYVFAPDCCLEVEITNVMCLNNGTSDPTDDQWTFDISVNSNSPNSCGYWKSVGDYEGAGSLNNTKVVFMGPISNYGSQVSFTVFDGCDEECFQEITLDVPSSCSPKCDLTLKDIEVSECVENQYYVQVTISGTNGDCWMAKQKKENGDEVLLGTFYGDGVQILGPFDPAEGNFTLWIKMCDQFDCLLDKYIFAPSCQGLKNSPSMRSISDKKSVDLYPNPAKEVLNISLNTNDYDSYKIHNPSGELIMDQFIEVKDYLRIETDHLKTGVYIISFYDLNMERKESKRFLIIK